jgi:hypothetical protein
LERAELNAFETKKRADPGSDAGIVCVPPLILVCVTPS